MVLLKLCLIFFSVHSAVATAAGAASGAASGAGAAAAAAAQAAEKCYDHLGCFPIVGDFIHVDPDSPDEIRTKFSLFTPNKSLEREIIEGVKIGTLQFHFETFIPEFETKIIIHGFLDNPELPNLINQSWMHKMKDEFLKGREYNVIIVDWSDGNHFPYSKATANTRVVGAQIAYLINLLMFESGATTAEKFHIIGHSLGSHIAGYAGERVKKLGRITGLDPAGPLFINTEKAVRLDETDAEFVDAIHTDGLTVFGTHFFGMLQPVGHVDFYPNEGHHQPGCLDGQGAPGGGFVEDVLDLFACDHLRSYRYYIESINSENCHFEAVPCDSAEDYENGHCHSCPKGNCNKMGFEARKTDHRTWYLDTAPYRPFCRYFVDMTITIKENPERTKNKGQVSVRLLGRKANTETILIDSETAEYSPGDVKSLTLDNKLDIGPLRKVELTWKHKPNRFLFEHLSQDGLLDVSNVSVSRLEGGLREEYLMESNISTLASGETAMFEEGRPG